MQNAGWSPALFLDRGRQPRGQRKVVNAAFGCRWTI